MTSEKDKMLYGEHYCCGDAELTEMWHRARKLTKEYCDCDSRDVKRRDEILTDLLGGRGKHLSIAPPFYVDYGENIFFGENCEVNFNCTFLDCNRIEIGDNALIAPNVQIYTVNHPEKLSERFPKSIDEKFNFAMGYTKPVKIGNNVFIGPHCGIYTPEHPIDAEHRNQGFEKGFPIIIGDNVWIGGGVTIVGGVTIGSNTVIGAGSVVTRNIPDNVIAFGNPCRVYREITDEDKKKFK